MFYKFSQILLRSPDLKLLDLDKTRIRGIQYVSIWSLHYVNQAIDKTLFDLKHAKIKVIIIFYLKFIFPSEIIGFFVIKIAERVAGCGQISETLVCSLQFEDLDTSKGTIYYLSF